MIVTLVEEESDEEAHDESQHNEKVSNEEDEVIYGNQDESLIVQRSLNPVQEKDEEDWLRKNIFHTRCTSHGKVCNVIIDGDNFENEVSEMVEKLCLKTEKHPQPYKLSWLCKGNGLKVNSAIFNWKNL